MIHDDTQRHTTAHNDTRRHDANKNHKKPCCYLQIIHAWFKKLTKRLQQGIRHILVPYAQGFPDLQGQRRGRRSNRSGGFVDLIPSPIKTLPLPIPPYVSSYRLHIHIRSPSPSKFHHNNHYHHHLHLYPHPHLSPCPQQQQSTHQWSYPCLLLY